MTVLGCNYWNLSLYCVYLVFGKYQVRILLQAMTVWYTFQMITGLVTCTLQQAMFFTYSRVICR